MRELSLKETSAVCGGYDFGDNSEGGYGGGGGSGGGGFQSSAQWGDGTISCCSYGPITVNVFSWNPYQDFVQATVGSLVNDINQQVADGAR